MIHLKSPRDVEQMRKAGALLAGAFAGIFELVGAESKTKDINAALEKRIVTKNAKPAFKGYPPDSAKPFPATACISIDEEVVHGIPSERRLQEGQIVGIDAGLILNGWYADMACSFLIGKVDAKKRKLWNVTKNALYNGIDQARAGSYLFDIGEKIQSFVERNGFSVIRDLVGHGIGRNLHEEPQVPNYKASGHNVKLRSGMTIAIEPMVSAGSWRIKVLNDGWTAVTADRKPSGHFEHTILITDDGPEILTLLEDGTDPWDLIRKSGE